MKANELMIGDWVRYGDKPVKVLQLSEEKNYKQISPIPLTEKILEKNGFVYAKHEFMTLSEEMVWRFEDSDEQTIVEIEEQVDDNGIDYYVGTFVCGANRCELYFQFVHQLQHTLRLCGIEKEIEL